MIYDASVSSSHLPAVVQGLGPEDVMPSRRRNKDPLAADHWARVVAGLLYVGCGGLDHAHNLVTPLCWGAATAYGGRPIEGSPAAHDAAYVHALIHRSEGVHDGEFGSGFSNANFWYKAAGPHPIHPAVLEAMKRHAAAADAADKAADRERLRTLVANHGNAFSTSRWVAVCGEAARSGGRDPALVRFVERVVGDEWRALLEHCYGKLEEVA
ncbi:hypothetical protein CHLRE_13g589100v5 [Chlamydomonas reinhardtii]|uniref:Uncharacterized protein n=1 Tax=Chlamydomonas reinhardtii TaxID=3055 RepID=A8HV24_CHLRE|nr:uncharacterized protein CHLRE_13g589100v5 [Chlamydomonas reinhardtii]PNW74197.1 hypothetical protein CHLRE_13g589100v5 [Chlamydomonas reinhardtii]|eukprot:XP_001693643.1 predicted protein [Chlamydomonas reinhardtii]